MAKFRTVGPLRTRAATFASALGAGMGRYRRLLRQRDTSLLLTTGIVSEIGDWFNIVALIALSYQFGDGALSVGLMLALRTVPRLVFQGPAGVLVDRWPGRGLVVVSHLLMAVLAAAFVALAAIPELWLLYALVVALETVNTVAFPAFRVQLIRETPSEQFAAVNGLLSIGFTAAQFVGPLLGGLVLAGFGVESVFLVNGLTFLAVAIVVARPRQDVAARSEPVPPPDQTAPEQGAASAVHGYGWLLRRTELALFAVAALGVTIAIRGTIALFVVRAMDLRLGEAGLGYFYAAVALGAIVGGIFAGAGTHAEPSALRLAAVAMAACAVAVAVFGVTAAPIPALAALVIAGLATNVYEVLALTFFQHRLPEHLYGRFMAIFMIALGIGGIIGALAGPLLQAATTVAVALAILAVPGIAFALALAVRVSTLPVDS